MVIIPSLIDENCDRDLVVTDFARMENKKFGMVSLVPNTRKAKQYSNLGAICADKNSIFKVIESIKRENLKGLLLLIIDMME